MSDFAESEAGTSVSNDDLVAAAAAAMSSGEQTATQIAADAALSGAEEANTVGSESDEPEVAAKPTAKAAPKADDDIDPREVLRSRMEKARAAKAAKAEARRQAEMQAKLREYEEATRSREPERPSFDLDGFKSKLYQSPLAALQELGLDLDTFTQRVVEESTPQSKMMAQMQELQARIEAFDKQRKDVEERERKIAEERQRHQEEQEFCAMITQDDYPSLYEWFSDDPHALVREAETVARTLLNQGNDPDDIEDADIADYLELKYAKKMERLKGVSAARKNTQPANASSKPRSPSQASASETKLGGPKNFWEMSEGEQAALLNEVARSAMSNTAN